jgi:hypothetical protein
MAPMKKVLAAAGFLAFFLPQLFAAEYPWEPKKNEDGIQVSVRKVEGSRLLEFRGVTIVDREIAEVTAFYEDAAHMKKWFHQCSESKLLIDESPDKKVLYFAIDLPWPVKDRDAVYRRIKTKTADGTVEYHAEVVAGVYPLQKDRIRMPGIRGVWRFTPLADRRTEVYYQQHGDSGGFIPVWLVNRLSVNIPFETLKSLRAALQKRKN